MLSLFLWGIDPLYIWVVTPLMLLSLWASMRVKGTFARYNQQPTRSGYSGADAARMILDAAGIRDVQIAAVPGMLSDHYDPAKKVVALSTEVLEGRTPAAIAEAAHECGHAIQDQQGYQPMRLRARLVPVANLGSMLAVPLIIFGILMKFAGLAWLGIVGFGFAVLFHLVTLPVEFDASRRAIRILEASGIVARDELVGVRKTLYAAGFTYVASALYAAGELIYWLVRSGLLTGSRSSDES